jgi:hypothetical protein
MNKYDFFGGIKLVREPIDCERYYYRQNNISNKILRKVYCFLLTNETEI